MKLYKLQRGSLFRVVDENPIIPPAAIPINTGDIIKLNNIDGMYSHCTNSNGDTVHLAAWTLVEKVNV